MNEKPAQTITAAAFIIAAASIASRVLGLIRDRILAAEFGAGDTLDVYYAAFRIPDFLYAIIIAGALSSAFIPVFTGLVAKEKKKEAWELAAALLNVQVVILGVLSIFIAIFAPYVTKLLAPGFSQEKLESITLFTRVFMLSPILWSIGAIFSGVLTSFKKFLLASISSIFYNVGIIVGALFFVKYMGPIGLAWGVILGVVLNAAIQYPPVRMSGFRFRLTFMDCLKNSDVKKVFYLMVPRSLALGASQVNLLIMTILASTLVSGSLSVFNFANNIQIAPFGIFALSFSIAVFPVLSEAAARNDHKAFVKNFSDTFRKILFFIIPFSAFMIILRAQIVRVFLGSGKFDWPDTVLTFQTMGILAASLAFQSVVPLLARAFYALKNTKTPFVVAIVAEIVNVTLAIIFINVFDKNYAIFGLAIAFSVASAVNALLLYVILQKHFHGLDERHSLNSLLKIILAALGAAVVIQWSKEVVAYFMDIDTFIGIFTQLAASGILGSAVFIYLSSVLKIEEAYQIKNSISKGMFKIKQAIFENTNQIS